tara:strand:- start:51 stop:947 length:897 start_codon:yes stop_codon:yes gene_type:complete
MEARLLHGPDQPKTTVTELAHEFRRVVRGHFFDATNYPPCDEDGEPDPSYIRYAREQQAKLRDVDAKHAADADSNVCYLADHYDSNEFMIEAWDNVACCRMMPGSWVHASLINDAWEAARGMGFAWPDDNDLPRPCPHCHRPAAYNWSSHDWEHVESVCCFLANEGQDDAQYAADPCDSCGDPAKKYTQTGLCAQPNCEDPECSEHGIDAMPERWAEPEPVVCCEDDCTKPVHVWVSMGDHHGQAFCRECFLHPATQAHMADHDKCSLEFVDDNDTITQDVDNVTCEACLEAMSRCDS